MKHGKSGFIVLLALVFQCTPHLFVGRRRRKFAMTTVDKGFAVPRTPLYREMKSS